MSGITNSEEKNDSKERHNQTASIQIIERSNTAGGCLKERLACNYCARY